ATLPGAVVEGAKQGFVKVLTQQGEDRILGVTIVSAQASETLAGFVVAMKYKLGLRKLGDTVQLSPTQAQALRRVAEAWRQQHRSARLLAWTERLNRWRIRR
ncbi:dihydrolipoamide dehydrogenase, partial [Pseudomonas guguanensis]